MRDFIDIVTQASRGPTAAREMHAKASPRGRELADLCGEKLAAGTDRIVFRHKTDPALVIKVELEYSPVRTCNEVEYEMWKIVEADGDFAEWFVPCVELSPCKLFLVQKKAENLFVVPEWLPEIFACVADMNDNGWGEYNGHPAIFDYGSLHSDLDFIRNQIPYMDSDGGYKVINDDGILELDN